MYELIQAGFSTYYMDCPSRCGIYVIDDNDVCIIDGGSDKGAAKKLSTHIDKMGWNPVLLLNTHSHADHVGGNAYLQQKYNLKIMCSNPDAALICNTLIQPTTLYGGYPNKDMLGKFFYAQPTQTQELKEELLPKGITFSLFSGHSPAQTAYKTKDNIWFIGDALTPASTIEKYNICYFYNIKETLASLEKLKSIEGKLYIPSHGEVLTDLAEVIDINVKHIQGVLEFLKKECKTPKSVDELLKAFFDKYEMKMSLSQNMLCSATFRSYMTYLYDEGTVEVVFDNNIMRYKLK